MRGQKETVAFLMDLCLGVPPLATVEAHVHKVASENEADTHLLTVGAFVQTSHVEAIKQGVRETPTTIFLPSDPMGKYAACADRNNQIYQ